MFNLNTCNSQKLLIFVLIVLLIISFLIPIKSIYKYELFDTPSADLIKSLQSLKQYITILLLSDETNNNPTIHIVLYKLFPNINIKSSTPDKQHAITNIQQFDKDNLQKLIEVLILIRGSSNSQFNSLSSKKLSNQYKQNINNIIDEYLHSLILTQK